ncbi:hypothetical protein N7E02_23785 [Aliirhizobium terrae]|uniref:hypothetical protein n=1 Tax=Terrirhizobium terrae TaxID=2926709 RepID=UPI0025749C8B|nr:hypothetical protein [Rhizobium sp. CC-CFT758]WJH39733.1 hypothetical protein N7E02_23785 [Rhizobium sp. CC-CFT758]
MRVLAASALIAAAFAAPSAQASEADFLKSIEGQWNGGGTVLRSIGGENVNVKCSMQSDASDASYSMDGSCRALVVVKRGFNASVKASGNSYSGTYTGASGKPSTLSGSRDGDTLSFDVTWANEEYGDRKATMTIQKVGEDGLRIRTIDRDPSSGKSVVTTDLQMRRS